MVLRVVCGIRTDRDGGADQVGGSGRIRLVDQGESIKYGGGAECSNGAVGQWSRGIERQNTPVRTSVTAKRKGALGRSNAGGVA